MDCCVSAGCLGTRIMCLSGLLCQCRMSRNEDNVFEWTRNGYNVSEWTGNEDNVSEWTDVWERG